MDENQFKKLLEKAEKENKKLHKQVNELKKEIEYIRSLRAFLWANRYYALKDELYLARHYAKRVVNVLKEDGPVVLTRKVKRKISSVVKRSGFSERVNEEIDKVYRELDKRYRKGEIKGIAVIPSGFEFDELYNQRTINFAKYLSHHEYGVLYFPWQWEDSEEFEKQYQEVYPHIFQIKMFDFLSSKMALERFDQNMSKVFINTFPASAFNDMYETLRSEGFTLIYDIMDEWEEFRKEGQAPWHKISVEESTVLASDYVVCVSEPLKQKFSHLRNDIDVIGNGYTASQIQGKGIARTSESEEKKIHIGYFGHLTESWFDWDILFELLEKEKNIHLHIIGYGASEDTIQKLGRFSNSTYYGKVQPTELKNHVKNWHIGMIPFKKGKLSEAVDPIKIYEYLYFGLPTVVTGISHLDNYPYCTVAENADDFKKAAADYYEKMLNAEMDREDLDSFLEETTWEKRFEQIMNNAEKKKYLRVLYHD